MVIGMTSGLSLNGIVNLRDDRAPRSPFGFDTLENHVQTFILANFQPARPFGSGSLALA